MMPEVVDGKLHSEDFITNCKDCGKISTFFHYIVLNLDRSMSVMEDYIPALKRQENQTKRLEAEEAKLAAEAAKEQAAAQTAMLQAAFKSQADNMKAMTDFFCGIYEKKS